jgi:hypothetical protein
VLERARGKEPPLPPWGEEPPPIESDPYAGADDGWSSADPGWSGSRGAEGPRANDLGSRWEALGSKLRALGPGATRLAGGRASLRGDVLVVQVPAGRALAEARRARGEPEVEGVLRTAFPKIRNIEVAPLPGTGTPADHEKALRQQVLDDPELRRIVQKLGAELESVTSLREDESPQ